MRLHAGSIFSPYFTFIKGITHLTDKEVLELLGFTKFQFHEDDSKLYEENLLYLTRDNNWVHIADNWVYSLWHSERFAKTIMKLSKSYEIFSCSYGDTDNSFEFMYYKNRSLIRKYVVDNPTYNKLELIEDIGTPFSIEQEALKIDHPLIKIMTIAKSLGINVRHDLNKVRCYEIIEPLLESTVFGAIDL